MNMAYMYAGCIFFDTFFNVSTRFCCVMSIVFYNDLCCFFQSVSGNMPLEAPETQPNEANAVTSCNALHMGLQIIFMLQRAFRDR